jgi:23S rRNA (adenine2503-C2)-methyltransferase
VTYDPPLLYDLELPALQAWLRDQGQPAYRAAQIYHWLYQRFARSFEEMTDLPQGLREVLAASFTLPGAAVAAESRGEETLKLLLQLPDGAEVECVSIAMEGLPTFCLSTQVGCSQRCAFCASTLQGCARNLSYGEILAQAALLGARQGRPGNIVFMGIGEPLLNLDNVVAAIARLTDPQAFGLSPRKISVPTVGIVPQIRKLGRLNLDVNLAVSLNASRDDQRRQLMPGTARWTIAELLAACAEFTAATGGQPITFAYVLIKGVNDFFEDADRLVTLLRPLRHHLNLIPLNPVDHALLQRPSEKHTRQFAEILTKRGLNVSLRHSKGTEIDAACGQLRQRHRRSL